MGVLKSKAFSYAYLTDSQIKLNWLHIKFKYNIKALITLKHN